MKKTFPVLIVLLTLFLGAVSCAYITPRELARTAMGETIVRLNIYAETNHAIPPSLAVLPRRAGYANQTMDAWHRPLLYQVSPGGVITLTSWGADGKPGGTGEDADMFMSYHARRPDGSLWMGAPLWTVQAEDPGSRTDH